MMDAAIRDVGIEGEKGKGRGKRSNEKEKNLRGW